ncbi:peptidylprolyl isomerase [Paenibacillus sp. MMS20-IR301]|uniref:peptidylprolyl isomerase n=1 Tax=Paenibacillus sp. MMS20-IR301 TaxID=2895946 RepID=UPI0028F07474|nr:peptidylprolyl isomerase [Paenibacillus sp. MMS20-IR301]WNS43145.1 peptidylprolyl isomerase [Paenibacillus sp. MMS20-IR301]
MGRKVKSDTSRYYVGGASLVLLAVLMIISVIYLRAAARTHAVAEPAKPGLSDVILYVNEAPVTRQEFQLYMDKEKGAVTNYFSVTYQAEDQPDYWSSEFGGERPIDLLKSRAAEEAAKGKLLQSIALRKGLVQDISYEQFLQDWVDGNKEREQEISRNEAVFGLGQYEQSQFYFYTLSNLRLELEELLGKEELQVSEEEVQAVYQAHAQDYQNQTRIVLEELSVPYAGEKEKGQALLLIQTALEQLNSGKAAADIKDRNERIRLTRRTATGLGQISPLSPEGMLVQSAVKLQAGSWSPVMDAGDRYSLVQLVDRTEQYDVPIEELAGQLKAEALQQKFGNYLQEQFRLSEVRLNAGHYEDITTP